MEVATFVIAVLGLLLSVVGLAWQAATYIMSGGRVKVDLKVAASNGRSMVTAEPQHLTPAWMKSLAEQGYGQPLVAVHVSNVGRMPVTVQRWSIKYTRGVAVTPVDDSIGKDLPYRLKAGESQTWAVALGVAVELKRTALEMIAPPSQPTTLLASAIRNSRGPNGEGVVGVVELGDGRLHRTRDLLT
jgi:hypothetical protein